MENNEGSNKKRGNVRQLTQFDEVDDTVGDEDMDKEFQKASNETLSKRRFVSTRKGKGKTTQQETTENESATEKPKLEFNFGGPTPTSTTNTSSEKQDPPKFDFGFDNQQKPSFDFGFTPSTTENTTGGFDFKWNPSENSFGGNSSSFFDTKSSFENSNSLFSNTNNTESKTFGEISKNQDSGFSFENKSDTNNKNKENDDEEDPEAFKPENTTPAPNLKLVQMTEEQIKTGEEDEEKLFAERSKLFVLVGEGENKSWKERGVGRLTINKSKDGSNRFVFRTDQTRMVRLNALIYKGMSSRIITEKAVTFLVVDSESESSNLQSFFVRFQNKELAQKLLSVLQSIEKNMGSSSSSSSAEAKTSPPTTSESTPKPKSSVAQTQTPVPTKTTQHAESSFVEGNVRGIITYIQNSDNKKTLIEGSIKGVSPNSKFTLSLDSKTLTSFSSNTSGEISFVANKVLNLIGSNSSLGSTISVNQESSSNSWSSTITKDDNKN
eukprot:TRINITY_DN6378_c0_g1_i1.p1 TRINITY_DN6378_c0_g1~~TRINITY_DN6378_c0_g1_i1.p1  ORF type:complete len:495 (+),score=216.26 TRINITY_DN6378_c0_g1_i1:61-1545(+)